MGHIIDYFIHTLLFCCILGPEQGATYDGGSTFPEQVHLSIGDNFNDFTITWSTMLPTPDSFVHYGSDPNLTRAIVVSGHMKTFVDGGSLHRKIYMHRSFLTQLKPMRKYYYRCGSSVNISKIFFFHTFPDTNFSPRFAVYGDLGLTNAVSLPRLMKEVSFGHFDVILHVGDFAYDMYQENATVADKFMRMIEPLAAYIPYMVCPGNHEYKYNFGNYKARFTMPVAGPSYDRDNIFYSYNVGPAHIISISTELYFFFYETGLAMVPYQYNWLKKDLQEANKPENRAIRPWIITMGHRPMYCSNRDGDDCTYSESIIRKGWPPFGSWGLEDLFYEQGVDLMIWAHEHSYERLWPIYNRKVCNGSDSHPYTNPRAPIHIISGSAGCSEEHDPFRNRTEEWSGFHSIDYGYSRMHIMNRTHIYVDYVSDDKEGKVIDSLYIIKERHGLGAEVFTCE